MTRPRRPARTLGNVLGRDKIDVSVPVCGGAKIGLELTGYFLNHLISARIELPQIFAIDQVDRPVFSRMYQQMGRPRRPCHIVRQNHHSASAKIEILA